LAPTEFKEVISGFGHPNLRATHHSTLEFTRDGELSKNGDCILVVSADKGLTDLGTQFKAALKIPHARLTVKIEASDISEIINAQGSAALSLSHSRDMVIRKSDFISERTLGICANKAAKDISRALVDKLTNPRQRVKINLKVQI
jgi:hypothetical protein